MPDRPAAPKHQGADDCSTGKDVSYREIYDLVHGKNFVSGHGEEGYRANARTFIKRIRKKLDVVDSERQHIHNYARFDYRWTGD